MLTRSYKMKGFTMKYYNSKRFLSRIADGFGRAVLIAAGVLAVGAALTASAADDWTDANNVTYTALKSLKGNGDGRGYLVTDIVPNCTDIVMMKFKPATVSSSYPGAYFCARNASANGMFTCYRPSNKIRLDRGASNTANQKTSTGTISTSYEYLLTADYGRRTATIIQDGSSSDLFGQMLGGDASYTVGSPLAFFALHKELDGFNSFERGYIYYFELYDSNTNLTHCLLPAQRNTDSVYGFYDTRTGTFYPQSGGAFTAAARTVTVTGTCKKWIGRGNDNKMSTGENWEGGLAPGDGDNLDFTLAPPLAEINADISGVTFGKLWIDDGDIPTFTGSMSVSDCNNRAKVAGNTSVVFTAGDYTWRSTETNWGDADAWTFDNAAATWADNNNAIFNTADATVTLDANASANSLAFNSNATVSGAAILTTPTVSVASGVSATISAPTDGALTKTGAGTLTLGSSRSAATTLAEGTLAFSGSASLDWSAFTFGTDPAKPVTLDLGPTATLSGIGASAACKIGGVANVTSTVHKAGGDWTFHDFVLGNASGAVTTFLNDGGNLMAEDYFRIGDNGSATFVVSGGTVGSSSSSSQRVFVGYTGEGTLVVTNRGVVSANQSLYVARSANGTISVSDGGRIEVGGEIIFHLNNTDGRGVINLGRGGLIVSGSIYDYRSGGSTTFNFDGGTLKRRAAGNFFAANNDAAAIDVTVSASGGTLDNNGFAVGLPRTITGAGGMMLSGSGTTTVSADQSYTGTTTVSNETTLSISGGVTFAGPVVFEAGAAFDIASATPGVASIAAATLAFPATGTVPLTFNGGAFAEGIYTVCSAPGLTAADGEKFSLATEGDIGYSWSVEDDTLVLTVGYVDPNAWTGRGGDGRMSTPGNWGGNAVPAAGADIDLSGISADTTIIADAGRTFGAVTIGSGVITFTNSFAATSFSDTSKVAVGADSIVTIEGDLVFSGSAQEYICHSVAAGGRFVVTGDIRSEKTDGHLYPSGEQSNPGVISAKGLVNNATNSDGFDLVRVSANWEIGANGISGTKRFRVQNYSNVAVMITATTNFTVSADIVQYRSLTLDTSGWTVSLGDGTSGGILGGAANGLTTVTGTGRVVVNYNVNDLSNSASSRTNAFTVATGATLTLAPGGNIGFGDLTVQDGGTLEIQSGTTTFGNLTVAENAILGFNFTDRRNAPVLALYDGAEVNALDPFTVKVSGTVWPLSGEKLLTTCGGFDGIPLTLSAAGNAARWANQDRLSVNADGNIVLDVKPMGTVILFR